MVWVANSNPVLCKIYFLQFHIFSKTEFWLRFCVIVCLYFTKKDELWQTKKRSYQLTPTLLDQ